MGSGMVLYGYDKVLSFHPQGVNKKLNKELRGQKVLFFVILKSDIYLLYIMCVNIKDTSCTCRSEGVV